MLISAIIRIVIRLLRGNQQGGNSGSRRQRRTQETD
jgi:hypothetical protein